MLFNRFSKTCVCVCTCKVNVSDVKNKIERAERLRERLKSAPPAKCGKLTEKLVRLLQEISGE